MSDIVNRRELTFKALAGLVGGLLGWLPLELTSHGHSLTEGQTAGAAAATFGAMALLSALIGGMINAATPQELRLTALVKRRFVAGFLICLVLAIPATYYSNRAFNVILAMGGWRVGRAGSVPFLIAGRLVGWTLMGLLLGAGVGVATFSASNIVKGAMGGLVGGLVGGAAFDLISAVTQGGLASRLFGFSALGLLIGLSIGLVQELTKNAWLRVEAGRLKGREFRLDKPITILGRAEESEVGLFGDPAVTARHATIERKGADFVLTDLSRNPGSFINGARVESAPLHNGDQITIGGYTLGFNLRTAPAGQSYNATPAIVATVNGSGPRLVDATGRNYQLKRGAPTTIGRALDNDLVLNEQSVSRHHARIDAQAEAFTLHDQDSQNGTYIHGQRVRETRLNDGDALRLGDVHFQFRV